MSYAVKEVFYTLQGEGLNIGRPAVFIRFAGCNLWSGREEDRAGAVCRFCDTDFVGGERYDDRGLLRAAVSLWPSDKRHKMVVLTGGEPGLQVTENLVSRLRLAGFYVAIETNGTQTLPIGIDWVCVSPKAGAAVVLNRADELKLVYPQPKAPPEAFAVFPAAVRWLSPMAGDRLAENTAAAADYCKAHPEWRLAIQAHKSWSIP